MEVDGLLILPQTKVGDAQVAQGETFSSAIIDFAVNI